MKALTAFRPRERRLALLAVVIIGCWVVVSWILQPLWDRVQALRLRVAAQTKKLEALNHLVTQASAIERDYQQVAGYLETQDVDRVQGAFLNELETLSRNAGLEPNLKPKTVQRDGRVTRYEVELDVEGSQEKLLAFLDALFRIPRLIAIERLRLSIVPAKEQVLRANVVIQKLSLNSL